VSVVTAVEVETVEGDSFSVLSCDADGTFAAGSYALNPEPISGGHL
jgi:hypothetical protein